MIRRLVGVLALLVLASSEQRCFIDPVWPPAQIVNTSGCDGLHRCAWSLPAARTDVEYGKAHNAYTKRVQPLLLDLYMPPASDRRTARPGFVLIHGGGFTGGDKARHGAGPGVEAYLAAALAQRGFVAVSINYRLTGLAYGVQPGQRPGTAGLGSDQYVSDARQDLELAVEFMRRNAVEWRVDPTRIGVGGESAGGITTEFFGYVNRTANVSVLVPISGALAYDAFCNHTEQPWAITQCVLGSWNFTAEVARGGSARPPLVMVHGTHDTVVPIREAKAIQEVANRTGLDNLLIQVPGAGHVPYEQLLGIDESAPAVLKGSAFMDQMMHFVADKMQLNGSECPQP